MLARLLQGSFDPRTVLLALIPAVAAAWLVARLVRRLASIGLQALLGDTLAASSPAVRGPLRLLGLAAFVLAFALLIVPILELAGLVRAPACICGPSRNGHSAPGSGCS